MGSTENVAKASSGTEHRWKVLWATFIGYLYDSYDLIILAIAMPVLLKTMNMTMAEGGLLGSATAAGAMFGSLVFGMIAENYGRKKAFMIALIWIGVATGAVVFVSTWGSWMALRFVAGVAIGGLWGPCAALIATHWFAEYRGRAASFVFSSFAAGAIVAALVGRLVLTIDWRYMFLLGTTSVLFAAAAAVMIPKDPPKPVDEKGNKAEKIGLGAIFEEGYGKIAFLAFLVSFFNQCGFWGVGFWLPTFLTKERGLSLTTMANFSLVMYIGMFIGYQAFGYLSDRIGRRAAMIFGFLLMSFSVGVYIVALDPTFLFYWGGVVGFSFAGIVGVVGSYYTELFPDRIRAYAGGACFNLGRIGAIIAPFTVGYVGRNYGLQIGLSLGCAIYLLAAFTLLFLPETLKKAKKMTPAMQDAK